MNRAALLTIACLTVLLLAAVVGLVLAVRSGPDAPPRAPIVPAGTQTGTAAGSSGSPAAQVQIPARALDDAAQAMPPPVGTAADNERGAARVERAKALAELRDSGPGNETWVGRATTLLEQVSKRSAGMTPEGCYIAGCAGTFVFPSVNDYERAVAAIIDLPDYRSWTGGKQWTTPEHAPDGRVVVGLLLYRPD
jgi:hypothetical protein